MVKRLILALAVSLFCVPVAAETGPHLAFAKQGWLYVTTLTASGRLARGKPVRVAKLPEPGETLRLAWSPDGKVVLVSGKREVWLVEARQGGLPQKVTDGSDAGFSPDGRSLVFADASGGVSVLDLATGRVSLLRAKAEQPVLEGDRVAVVDAFSPTEFSATVLVLEADGGKVRFTAPAMVNPIRLLLSPDGRYLAFEPHLSRPLSGSVIFDTRTGKQLDGDPYQPGYAPGPIQAWSQSGRWLLWTWRVPDPGNDGSWRREELWAVSFDGRETRRLGVGSSQTASPPAFSPDGRHALWLRPSTRPGRAALMWGPISGHGPVRLLADVEAFAVSP